MFLPALKAFGAKALALAISIGDTVFLLSKKPGLTRWPPPAAINADLKSCAALLPLGVTPGGNSTGGDPSNPLKLPVSADCISAPPRNPKTSWSSEVSF